MDPVALVILILACVVVFSFVTHRIDVVGAVVAGAFLLILWVLFVGDAHTRL